MIYLQKYCENLCFRSSHPEVFLGKDVLKICREFTGEQPCQIAISIKLQSNFIEITLRHGCSPVNLLHIFRTTFLKNTSRQILPNSEKTIRSHYSNICSQRYSTEIWSSTKNELFLTWLFPSLLLIFPYQEEFLNDFFINGLPRSGLRQFHRIEKSFRND